jgi:hypothetical protein
VRETPNRTKDGRNERATPKIRLFLQESDAANQDISLIIETLHLTRQQAS